MERFACRPAKFFLAACLLLAMTPPSRGDEKLSVVCDADNDVLRVLGESGIKAGHFDGVLKAIDGTTVGGGILVLADGYPAKQTDLPDAVVQAAGRKKQRLFVEFPSSLPGIRFDAPRTAEWERGIVANDQFGQSLMPMRLVGLHACTFLPTQSDAPLKPQIVLGRVAGFDTAVFGLPKNTNPLLFVLPGNDQVMVCTTKFSQFVTARYAPTDAWRSIWTHILTWLGADVPPDSLKWTPSVAPSFEAKEPLPKDAEREAVRRGAAWYSNAKLFVHPDWIETLRKAEQWRDRVGRVDLATLPCGDGSLGMLEGFNASIDARGNQPLRWWVRGDCNGDSAFAMASAGKLLGDERLTKIASNLNAFVFETSELAAKERRDPASAAYGLVGWDASANGLRTFYGDDNAQLMLGTIGSSAAMKSDHWDAPLLRCLLGNVRTTGPLGFRPDSLHQDDLIARGWESFFKRKYVRYAPHFNSWPWACYLWAYDKTHYELFRQRAITGLGAMMKAYPNQWQWTNGLQQERARMLLPLAWLVRVDDTPEHRGWLKTIADDLITSQDACGAIREQLGTAGLGMFAPPASNEAYGTDESPLIQKDGDALSDLLYTTNFAFLGLHEAAAATGEKRYIDAENRLADFLCRIQVRSIAHPELDGGWFRAFDYRRWDYWASSGDHGWGAWSIETGWTQAWIVSTMAMRQLNTSLWESSRQSTIAQQMPKLQPQMIPDDVVERLAHSERIKHGAVGKPVTLIAPPDPAYAATGAVTLTDGIIGDSEDFHSGWLGFHGINLDATIDLGEPTDVRSVSGQFFQLVSAGIYLPRTVDIFGSMDGKTFAPIGTIKNDVPQKKQGPLVKSFDMVPAAGTRVRYVRLQAANVGKIPAGAPADVGQPAWLFVDEIAVNAK